MWSIQSPPLPLDAWACSSDFSVPPHPRCRASIDPRQVYLREFNYSFRARRACLAAGRRFARSDHRGRGRRHRAAAACVGQDTFDTVYQSAVELNRLRDCNQGSVYDWYLVDIGVDRDFPVLPNGNDSSSVDVARPNVISPVSRPSWHRRKVLRKSFIYPPQELLRKSCRF